MVMQLPKRGGAPPLPCSEGAGDLPRCCGGEIANLNTSTLAPVNLQVSHIAALALDEFSW